MRVAVIGSRTLTVRDLGRYLPEGTTEIISGGARGVDACAREYALTHSLPLTEFLPEYEKYGRSAPLKRNLAIIARADLVLAFWDGRSRGTKFVIDNCRRRGRARKNFRPCRRIAPGGGTFPRSAASNQGGEIPPRLKIFFR